MQVHPCTIEGLRVIQPDIHRDGRGFFIERFQRERFADAGFPGGFPQANQSRSLPGVLRGLHYQSRPAQGKMVSVTRGRVWDVAVDIRPGSVSFGQHYALELSGENGLMLWIPPGFAHGFCVLGDEAADMLYMVSELYNAASEGGIRHDDPALGIEWPVAAPIVSARDRDLPGWADYCANPPSWGDA